MESELLDQSDLGTKNAVFETRRHIQMKIVLWWLDVDDWAVKFQAKVSYEVTESWNKIEKKKIKNQRKLSRKLENWRKLCGKYHLPLTVLVKIPTTAWTWHMNPALSEEKEIFQYDIQWKLNRIEWNWKV